MIGDGFAEQLAMDVEDKRSAFDAALELLDDPQANFETGMLRGLLRGIDKSDPQLADECLANAKVRLGTQPLIDLYTSLSINDQRLALVIEDVKAGRMDSAQAVFLSYGQGLNALPETEDQGQGEAAWHPALERLAKRYGDSRVFREALARRIHPTSWSGSIVKLLEAYLEPIESWFDHPSRPLSNWAREQHNSILRLIESDKQYEAKGNGECCQPPCMISTR